MDLNFTNLINAAFWVKVITLIVIVFYAVFTFVVFTQVKVMGEILHLPNVKAILQGISVVFIIFAISLFLMALVIL